MGFVKIDNLTEGMVLNSDIHDRSGRLLLGCGIELNAKHLRMLRIWGVSEADIAGADGQSGGEILLEIDIAPERLIDAENELRVLFRNTDLNSPVMDELFRLCLLRKVRNEYS